MERTNSPARNSRSRSTTPLCPSPNAGLQASADDHKRDSSPMRKKPRLDGGSDGAATSMPGQDAASEHHATLSTKDPPSSQDGIPRSSSQPDLTSPSQPSRNKITLNLRTQSFEGHTTVVDAGDADPEMSSSVPGSEASGAKSSDTIDLGDVPPTEHSAGSSSTVHSPVIEIDPDEVDDDDQAPFVVGMDEGPLEDQLMSQFPFGNDMDPVEASAKLTEVIAGSNLVPVFEGLCNWMKGWNTQLAGKRMFIPNPYTRHLDFWHNFGAVFARIILKKTTFGPFPVSVPSEQRLITNLFTHYAHICGHMVQVDLPQIKYCLERGEDLYQIMGFAHLRNLDRILRSDGPLWTVLEVKYGMRLSTIARSVGASLALDQPESIAAMTELASLLSKHLPSKIGLATVFHQIMSILEHVATPFLHVHDDPVDHVATASQASLHIFASKMFPFARTLSDGWAQGVAKQPSGLPVEISKTIAISVSQILLSSTAVDSDTAIQALEQEYPDCDAGVHSSDVSLLVQFSILLRLYWSFISKGRMELRVLGIESLVPKLVDLFNDHRSQPGGDALLSLYGLRLGSFRPVQYLLSVESHPQLLLRSADLAGFLLITKTWTEEMTDAIWATMTASQDPHFAAAAIDMCCKMKNTFDTSDVLSFCRRMKNLPLQCFGERMIDLLTQLFADDKIDHTIDPEQRLEPYRVAAQLLRICHTSRASSDLFAKVQSLEHAVNHCLALLHHRRKEFSERAPIYLECAEDVRRMTNSASESLEIIRALLMSSQMDDLSLLLQEVELVELVSENICAYVDSQRNLEAEQQDWSQLSKRVRFLSMLIVVGPSVQLPEDLESNLWNHLFGEKSLSAVTRNETWMTLSLDVANQRNPAKGPIELLDRFIDKFLPSFKPDAFTEASLRFIEGAIPYKFRFNPVMDTTDGAVISIPLTDLLWYIIFNAAPPVSQAAIQILCKYHLDSACIKKAAVSSLAATHASLVDHSITQLQLAAASVVSWPPDGSSLENPELDTTRQRFHRSLDFLRTFLQEVKQRQLPRIASPQVPSPKSGSPSLTIVGEPREFNFQVFNSGQNKGTRVLKIGSDAPYSEFVARVRRLTGFVDMLIILGGQKLDLADNPSLTVKDLPAGNMIVQSKGPVAPARSGITFAEEALTRHIDQLYEFLDLDDALAESIYRFMHSCLPPHRYVKDLVVRGASSEELFPLQKLPKALYAINCMSILLRQQISDGFPEDSFVFPGIKILTAAVTKLPEASDLQNDRRFTEFALCLVSCLLTFLKARPFDEAWAPYIEDEAGFVAASLTLLRDLNSKNDGPRSSHSWHVFSSLLDASLHSQGVWNEFSTHCETNIFKWLLLESPESALRRQTRYSLEIICTNISTPSAIPTSEVAAFTWQKLVEIIPDTILIPNQCSDILHLAYILFPLIPSCQDEETVKSFLQAWSTLLLEHKHVSQPGRREIDPFVYGMARLLTQVVNTLKSFKKPIDETSLIQNLMKKYLFPELSSYTHGQIGLQQPSAVPILDPDTRKELYSLLLALCQRSEAYKLVIDELRNLLMQQEVTPLPPTSDRSKWLRSSAGYSGLRNLTNTCYMNSLLTQLFMNSTFRSFMVDAKVADADGSQRLLYETQVLFTFMLESQQKFADTQNFAAAIKPYEGNQIDVAIQMDVDEFFNLLFDRWESQLISSEAKRRFRSFYGGESVTQIKSFDCNHVSERSEHFFTIQCDIKGKANLHESLKAYTEGDMMQGDNRYKCETCGGKFVDAVKRSCLKDVPDNVIFHLKRFDFDLTTMQRSKINDYFEFPELINLTPFKLKYMNDPEGQHAEDHFRLTGVLIHNGTAETGHYYSFIRLPNVVNNRNSTWVEFNDTEVSDFGPEKLADHAYGGRYLNNDGSLGWLKHHNAYMLFYERIKTDVDDFVVVESSMKDSPQQRTPYEINEHIRQENEILLRKYCLMDPCHSQFVRTLFSNLKNMDGGVCSEDHELEKASLSVMMMHLDHVVTRIKENPDLESAMDLVKHRVANCSQCIAHILDWLSLNRTATQNMLLATPATRVREAYCGFVVFLLESLSHSHQSLYGISLEDTVDGRKLLIDPQGCFPEYVEMLKDLIPRLGRYVRHWNEFFGLWQMIARLGAAERAFLLQARIFEDALELLLMEPHVHVRRSARMRDVFLALSKEKRQYSYPNLVSLIGLFVENIDPYADPVSHLDDRIHNFDADLQVYPLTHSEQELLTSYDPNSRQNQFLMRCIDQADFQLLQPWVPSAILKKLLTSKPPHEECTHISQTLVTAIEEYIPAYIRPALYTAATFCQYSEVEGQVNSVIKATAKNAEQLESNGTNKKLSYGAYTDPDAEGGHATLEFFSRVASMADIRCIEHSSNNGEHDGPLLKYVLRWVHLWAPALLYFDDKSVRDSAFQLLDTLIFGEFPRLPSDELGNDRGIERTLEESDIDDLNAESALIRPADEIRTSAIGTLFNSCKRQFTAAFESKLPKAYVHPLLDTMAECASWASKLRRSASPAHKEMHQVIAEQDLERKWHQVANMFGGWPEYENEEAFSGTEYASNGEDESDEIQSEN